MNIFLKTCGSSDAGTIWNGEWQIHHPKCIQLLVYSYMVPRISLQYPDVLKTHNKTGQNRFKRKKGIQTNHAHVIQITKIKHCYFTKSLNRSMLLIYIQCLLHLKTLKLKHRPPSTHVPRSRTSCLQPLGAGKLRKSSWRQQATVVLFRLFRGWDIYLYPL